MFEQLKRSIEDGKRRIDELEKMAEEARDRQAERKRLKAEAANQNLFDKIDAAIERYQK